VKPLDRLDAASARVPDYLRDSTAMAIARLEPDGSVADANLGFLRAAGGPEPDRGPTAPWNAAAAFIQPALAELLARRGGEGDLVFVGILNLGRPEGLPASLKGSVYRHRGGLFVVAEHDPEEWDRLRGSVLALNRELAETQRQLVRDIQARRRAEAELAETNRGILALYAELEDKAAALRRAGELKSRFLSNMSHEFRTPINAILSLSRLLLDGDDGDGRGDDALNPEQRMEVTYIRQSAQTLSELINDLLDLAKIEAGKTTVRRLDFSAADLFAALRGMMRPLLGRAPVELIFDDPAGIPTLKTDQGKVAQILRNFISNALKFTVRGEVRVSAAMADASTVAFSVADTGIGIAAEDQPRVFDEFAQVENPLQSRLKGTGLGLSLSRQLAVLLGGDVTLTSEPGVGSTFRLLLPVEYNGPVEAEVRDLPAGARP
jgi:signal transduction histidine kinase